MRFLSIGLWIVSVILVLKAWRSGWTWRALLVWLWIVPAAYGAAIMIGLFVGTAGLQPSSQKWYDQTGLAFYMAAQVVAICWLRWMVLHPRMPYIDEL